MSSDLTTMDETKPNGATETVATLGTYVPEVRKNLKDWAIVEHQLVGGRHKFPFGTTANRPTTGLGAGVAYFNNQTNVIEYYDGAAWQTAVALFPSGTRMVFDQDTAPTGWTRDTAINDVVITLVSGARVHGGSWTVSGLTIASHTHSISGRTDTQPAGPGVQAQGGSGTQPTSAHSHDMSSGSITSVTPAVSSDGTWRPAQRDMIVCPKD